MGPVYASIVASENILIKILLRQQTNKTDRILSAQPGDLIGEP